MSVTQYRRRGTRKILAVVAALALGLTLAACGSSDDGEKADSSTKLVTWKHGLLNPGTESGFLLMAQEKGLFKKYGVDLKIVTFASGQQLFPALIAGQVDSIEGSPGALFPAVEKGADLRIVGSSMPGLSYAIYAKKGIESVEQLKGKTLAISVPNSLPAQVLQAIMLEKGVGLDDVKYVNAGSNADRYKAVVAGTADAAISPSDFVPQAEADGINVIAESTKLLPDFPRFTILANGKALKNNPQGMIRFMAAQGEGLQYAVDHPDEAAALTAKTLKLKADDPMVTYATEDTIKNKLVTPDLAVPKDQVIGLEELLIKLGQLKQKIDIDAFIDTSFAEQAAALQQSKN
jgi:NitT/TauT family transport system substrate-binding protein